MPRLKRIARGPTVWIVVALLLLLLAFQAFGGGRGPETIDTQDGLELLADGRVTQARIVDGDQRVDLTLAEPFDDDTGTSVQFFYVEQRGEEVIEAVSSASPEQGFTDEVPQGSILGSLLLNLLPILLLVGLFWFFLANAQGGGSRVMQFGKSKAKLVSKEAPKVTFADVAGASEAVEELREIKEFLSEPAKFQAVGAKIPKGVLLYGQPGTGKTLLARAVAGEAGVPFYSISGSDFVEMFVGVGASRVRDLFEQAKNNAPAIIFVDEIDAVGRHRGAGMGGGHDEREQTLNQLLVEMDGFDVKTNVILIAATNRPDILDPALLRPGRFDRQIAVDAPDLKGREAILAVHAKGKPMAPGTDLATVARRTPGFSGADLANVLNEAALLAARTDRTVIGDTELDEAIDRVLAGPQKRTRVMSEKERKITAYHEGGHALVAAAMRHTDPVSKVTILPRGRALGYTMVLPVDDKYSTTRNEILDQLAYALGGRVAEEIVFHDPTTGASNDIEKATATARKMVTQFGMSERIGAIQLGQPTGEVFMQYRDGLDHLVLELMEKETLNAEQIAEVFAPVQKRPLRPVWLSSERRSVSDRPPVLSALERRQLNGHANGNGAAHGNGAANGAGHDGSHDEGAHGERVGGSRRMGTEDRMAPQDEAAAAKPEHPAEVRGVRAEGPVDPGERH